MHLDIKSLDFFIETFGCYFQENSNNFYNSIQKLTKNWSTSGYKLNSLLTPNKSSLEFSYSFNNPSISYTVDVIDALESPQKKLEYLNTYFGISLLETYPSLKPFSQDSNQKYGSWLSVRHLSNTTYYKIYQEVTSQMQHKAKGLVIEHFSELQQFSFDVKLIGHVLSVKDQPEYYLSLGYVDESTLFDVMKIANVQKQTPYFISQIGALIGKSYTTVLADIKVGISLKVTKDKPLLTVFFHAPELFSDNKKAVRKIKHLAEAIGGDVELYDRLTKNISDSNPEAPIHSILSFKFFENKPLQFSVGISPY
nr:hypothetical protein [uncultured Psychroserpens sp.]